MKKVEDTILINKIMSVVITVDEVGIYIMFQSRLGGESRLGGKLFCVFC